MSVPTAAGGPAPWWLAYPDVWEAEAAALAAVGATWSRRSTRGQAEQLAPGADLGPRLALRISWPHRRRSRATRTGSSCWSATRRATRGSRLGCTCPSRCRGWCATATRPTKTPCACSPWTTTGSRARRWPSCSPSSSRGCSRPAVTRAPTPRRWAWRPEPSRPGPAWSWFGARCWSTPPARPPAEVPGGLADLVSVGHADNPVHALVTLLDGDQHVLWAAGTFPLRVAARVPWVRLPTLPPGPLHPSELWHRG
jgi:hypothetical protein